MCIKYITSFRENNKEFNPIYEAKEKVGYFTAFKSKKMKNDYKKGLFF